MKKQFSFFLILICLLLPFSAGKVQAVSTCGYCGWFFIFSDSKPYSECQKRNWDCVERYDDPGELNVCLCQVEDNLNKIYTREYLAQKELFFWVNLLTKATGASLGQIDVATPGLAFMDPDQREYLLSGKGRFHEYTSAIFGSMDQPPLIKAASVYSSLVDDSKPKHQRLIEATIDLLPDNNKKTTLHFFYKAHGYYKESIEPYENKNGQE